MTTERWFDSQLDEILSLEWISQVYWKDLFTSGSGISGEGYKHAWRYEKSPCFQQVIYIHIVDEFTDQKVQISKYYFDKNIYNTVC